MIKSVAGGLRAAFGAVATPSPFSPPPSDNSRMTAAGEALLRSQLTSFRERSNERLEEERVHPFGTLSYLF